MRQVSLTIDIELPGLTRERAIALDRAADVAAVPLQFTPPRQRGRIRRARPAGVTVEDLREDPSIASEALDYPDAWPQAQPVRDRLIRAVRFLGENAPAGRFTFRAGWGDHQRNGAVELDFDAFLASIADGTLQADRHYEIRVKQRPDD